MDRMESKNVFSKKKSERYNSKIDQTRAVMYSLVSSPILYGNGTFLVRYPSQI